MNKQRFQQLTNKQQETYVKNRWAKTIYQQTQNLTLAKAILNLDTQKTMKTDSQIIILKSYTDNDKIKTMLDTMKTDIRTKLTNVEA